MAEQAEGAPSTPAAEAMAAHLHDEHGREFELSRDVSFPGNAAEDAVITFEGASPARGARYWCRECPGQVFSLEEPARGTPERNSWLRQHDPGLQAALASVPASEHERFTEAWDQGEIGAAALAGAERRTRQKVSRKSRPDYLRRVARAGDYLLDAYARLGRLEDAIDSLIALREQDPKRYREIMGSDRVIAFETIRSWWQKIPLHERELAKRRYLSNHG